jgi:hypothetical protein
LKVIRLCNSQRFPIRLFFVVVDVKRERYLNHSLLLVDLVVVLLVSQPNQDNDE